MFKYIIVGIIIWLILGLGGVGFTNAYFQNKYQKCGDPEELGFAMVMVIGGPINLFVAYLHSGFGLKYGWSLKLNACDKLDVIGKETTFVRPNGTLPISGSNMKCDDKECFK